MQIKITLSTGKTIELTGAELHELMYARMPLYMPQPIYPSYPSYPFGPIWYSGTETTSNQTEAGPSWPQGSRETYGSKSTNRE